MRKPAALVTIAAVVPATVLATALLWALQTSTEYSSKVDFARYKTWSWGPVDVPENPVAEKRIRDAVETRLAAKGWTRSESGPGDALVSVHGVVKDTDNFDVLYSGWAPGFNGAGYGIGSGVGTSVQTKIRSGTLVIDIFDASTKTLIWRGTAEGTLGAQGEADQNLKKVDQAIEKLLKGFPPAPAANPPAAKTPTATQPAATPQGAKPPAGG